MRGKNFFWQAYLGLPFLVPRYDLLSGLLFSRWEETLLLGEDVEKV